MQSALNFLAGGGEMGALMRAHDWASTPLGPPDKWPPTLKTTLRLILTSNHPMFVWWGPDLRQFYNDAYRATLGPERHPAALGQRGKDCWAEVWPIIGPEIDYVMSGQGATWHEDALVPVTRHGKRENVWWTYGYSPIEDESGVRGVLVVCNDITRARTNQERLEQFHHAVVQSMDEGFCILDILFDAAQRPVDYRYLETNPAFEKQSGLAGATGKTIRELVPDIEGHWIDTYGRVALTGEPVRYVNQAAAMGKWFDVYATRVGGTDSRQVAVLFKDITEQKRAEEALRASEERFRLLSELSPDGILVNADGRFVYANPAAVRMVGARDAVDLLARPALDFIDPTYHESVRQRIRLVLVKNQVAPLAEQRWRRVDGTLIDVQTTASRLQWEGRPAVQVLLRDITELKQTRDRLRITSERLKLALEGTGEGIWDWNVPDKTFTFSGGLRTIFANAEERMHGSDLDWRRLVHPDDAERVTDAFRANIEGRTDIYRCEYRMRALDGSWKWVRARGLIVERDSEGRPLAMTGTLTDITAQKEADELAWRHANLDTLTALPNRRLFRDRLELELRKARRNDRHTALLFADLDGFKQVNDLYGHETGDLLLMEAAHRIQHCVRETDVVARLGGDEFTVILTDLTDLGHVEFVCQKILGGLCTPFAVGKEMAYVSASIGVSLAPFDAATAQDLIRKADQAMYAAKQAGKNQFSYFTREMDERAHTRLRLTNELRHALKGSQLHVHYQPVVDLTTGRIGKAEALLRWSHPTLGEIPPAAFIPIAEESGLINEIGNWVFREAAGCCKRCSEETGTRFQIGVNKSPVQFMARDADMDWLQHLAEQTLPASSIAVEITEGVLLQASERVADTLLAYRQAGMQVALDDFGTGYSSMSYLLKFRIDYVKIDQSFVHSITTEPGSRAIAETIIMMAHRLGQKVIAEGIETREQLDCLVAAGCDYGQGYLFAHPVPEDELMRIVRAEAGMPARLM